MLGALAGRARAVSRGAVRRGELLRELEFLGDVRKGAGGEKKRSETVGGGGSNKSGGAQATVAANGSAIAAIEGARFAELVAEGTELRRRMVRESADLRQQHSLGALPGSFVRSSRD